MADLTYHRERSARKLRESSPLSHIKGRLVAYWQLIKSLQTGLLLATGLAGFGTAQCPVLSWTTLLGLAGSLFLSISGSTLLNMVYDRDIDGCMKRTSGRPLPSGRVGVGEALALGIGMSALGVGWAFLLNPLYGVVVSTGLLFDVVVYTLWLKRRTPWAIVWGGMAGGMPVLAGRVLGTGGVDWIGLSLAAGVLFWIPIHIMTFSMRYYEDYRRVGIPTFPEQYGFKATRRIIAVSSLLAASALVAVAVGLGLSWGYLRLLALLSALLFALVVVSLRRPSERLNFMLFKFASLYMLGAMVLLVIGIT